MFIIGRKLSQICSSELFFRTHSSYYTAYQQVILHWAWHVSVCLLFLKSLKISRLRIFTCLLHSSKNDMVIRIYANIRNQLNLKKMWTCQTHVSQWRHVHGIRVRFHKIKYIFSSKVSSATSGQSYGDKHGIYVCMLLWAFTFSIWSH